MKKFLTFICAVLFSLCLVTPAFAVSQDKVIDNGELLSDSEESSLEKKAQSIVDKYNMDTVIVTTNSTDGKDIESYSNELFNKNDCGLGDSKDGVILVVDMNSKQWYINTYGNGQNAFTQYGRNYIGDNIKGDFSKGKYYSAFNKYLDYESDFLKEYSKGKPYDSNHKYRAKLTYGAAFLISLIIAVVAVLIMKLRMKNVARACSAGSYVVQNSLNLTQREDRFITTTINKTPRPKENNHDSGSNHSSSGGGFSGTGGSF